jgi:outer membrane lipoprotein LolB
MRTAMRPLANAAAAAAAAATLLVSGCASAPPRLAGEAPWTSGRLSVRIEATPAQMAQSMSAAFDLRAQADSGELRLNTPLGTRVATARWSPGEAVLVTSEGERRFDDLQMLSRQALGEALPLEALPDWLAGRPWARASSSNTENGFEQLGWLVNTSRRKEGLIEATRAAPPAVAVRVRLDETTP